MAYIHFTAIAVIMTAIMVSIFSDVMYSWYEPTLYVTKRERHTAIKRSMN